MSVSEPVIDLLNERIKQLLRQNSDLQACNTRLLLENRELKAQLVGHEAIVEALSPVLEPPATEPPVPFCSPLIG